MLLVTGAGGYLGHFVTRELSRNGIQFRGMIRPSDEGAFPFPTVVGELGDPESLRKACEGSTGIIHLACTLSSDPLTVLDVDVKGTLSLLEEWGSGPFILASSMDVYPMGPSPLMEEAAPEPTTWYGLGKVICEQQVRLNASAGQKPHLIFRIPRIVGVHERVGSSLFGRMAIEVLRGTDIVVPDLHTGCSWVSAVELARAITLALMEPHSGVYNISNGWVSWHDAARTMIDRSGSTSRIKITDESKPFQRMGRALDCQKLLVTYGFSPHATFEGEMSDLMSFLVSQERNSSGQGGNP